MANTAAATLHFLAVISICIGIVACRLLRHPNRSFGSAPLAPIEALHSFLWRRPFRSHTPPSAPRGPFRCTPDKRRQSHPIPCAHPHPYLLDQAPSVVVTRHSLGFSLLCNQSAPDTDTPPAILITVRLTQSPTQCIALSRPWQIMKNHCHRCAHATSANTGHLFFTGFIVG